VNAANDPPTIGSVDQTTNDPEGPVNLSNSSETPDDQLPIIDVNEDLQLNADGNPVEQTIVVGGISGGPGEPEQTVSIVAQVDKPNVITGLIVDPPTVAVGASSTLLKYKLAKNQFGTNIISLFAVDNGAGTLTTLRRFKLVVNGVNDPPVINEIGNRTIPKDTGTAVPITVTDIETQTPLLTMRAEETGGKDLIDDSQLVFDAGNTTLSVIPRRGVTEGDTTITVTARDRGATDNATDTTTPLETTRSFKVTVANVAAPTIAVTGPTTKTIPEDSVASFPVVLSDDTPVDNLVLRGVSDNQALVADNRILFGGTGANRSVIVSPNKDASGTAKITISATDIHQLDAFVQVTVNVTPVDDLPVIEFLGKANAPAEITSNEDVSPVADTDTDSDLIEFNVSDA
jgi:hypothetical protein